MSFLLFAVAALHVLILLLLFVITLDKGWWVLPDAEKLNLWYDCVFQNSTQSWLCASVANSPGLHAVRGLLLGALLLSSGAFGLFLWQLHAGPRGRRFAASAGTQLPAGLAVLVGAGLYAAQGGHPPGGHFGHCFVLAWLCGPLALASGVTYGHLRKRE
ncbi:epithelial membrane protein 3 isoform X1 [Ciconia boyciana]|uniref:epithelial membrane protein 3 isoform X1 n=1 Tax=Ciconia boyciana TaxID=52775 RepID=UPI003BA184A6